MVRAHIREDKILSEYPNNRNQFISKAGAIFVQPVCASTSSLSDSFCFYILSKWGSSLDDNIPMRKNGSFVRTYLTSMKTGATTELARTLVFFYYYFNLSQRIHLIVV